MKIGNTKLSYSIINKMMMPKITVKDEKDNDIEISNVTSTEIDLLLYMSLRQDILGGVEGIYYDDVCLELGITKQTFYNALYGLEAKKYIKIKSVKGDYWNVVILDNVFMNKNDYKRGYLNINKEFLYSWDFKRLKANEKKICLKLLIGYKHDKGMKISPSNIAKWLGIKSKSMTIIYNYCENIQQFFSSKRIDGLKGELIYFSKNTYYPFNIIDKTEREHYLTHKIKHFCRQFKINYTMKDLKDLIILLAQYAKRGIGKLHTVICNVLLNKKSIEPKLINFLLSDADIEENESPGADSGADYINSNMDIDSSNNNSDDTNESQEKKKNPYWTKFHITNRAEKYTNEQLESILGVK